MEARTIFDSRRGSPEDVCRLAASPFWTFSLQLSIDGAKCGVYSIKYKKKSRAAVGPDQ